MFFPLGWQHYLLGGLIVGASAALLFVDSRNWRLIYALGLILGAALWWLVFAGGKPETTAVPAWQLLLGGVLVGYGARRGNGCTSGHGICGLGSMQWPSMLAVLTFMATAFLTANLVARWLP